MSKLEKIQRYTTIIHQIRIELDLSCNEYCVADMVFSLSNNPDSKVQGWCYASKQTIGDFMGIHERRIRTIIDRLVEKGLLEKDEDTKYLRTTSLWYQSVVLERLKMKNVQADKTSAMRTKGQKEADKTSAPQADNLSDNKNNTINTSIKTIAPGGAGKEINDLISFFEAVNPSFKTLYPKTTERKALERMVKEHGREKIEAVIKNLPKTNGVDFAPVITTPWELEKKLGKLIAYYRRKKAETKSRVVTL